MIATFQTDDLLRNLRAALRAVSVDPERKALNQIQVELGVDSRGVNVARFVATNGHWLWLSEVGYRAYASSPPSTSIRISADSARAIIKALLKTKHWLAQDVDIDPERRVVQQCGTTVQTTFEESDPRFPPYAQIIPHALAPKVKGKDMWFPAVDAQYVADVAASFNDIEQTVTKRIARSASLAFQPCGGELDPVVVTSHRSTALVVLMPQRQDPPQGAAMLARFHAAPLPVSGAA